MTAKLWLLAAMLFVIGAALGWHHYKIAGLERSLREAEKRADYTAAQLEACTYREADAKEALNHQAEKILAENARLTEALTAADAEIERIRAEYAGRKTELITRLIKDNSCEERLRLIEEAQEAFYRGGAE